MQNVSVIDIARRFRQNPLLTPKDVKPSMPGMLVESLLNPGVFRFDNKIWLLIRVAERPEQREGHVSIPIYGETGEIRILQFDKDDPLLDLTDPHVISYKGKDYLTTLSHLRLICIDDAPNELGPEILQARYNSLRAAGCWGDARHNTYP